MELQGGNFKLFLWLFWAPGTCGAREAYSRPVFPHSQSSSEGSLRELQACPLVNYLQAPTSFPQAPSYFEHSQKDVEGGGPGKKDVGPALDFP